MWLRRRGFIAGIICAIAIVATVSLLKGEEDWADKLGQPTKHPDDFTKGLVPEEKSFPEGVAVDGVILRLRAFKESLRLPSKVTEVTVGTPEMVSIVGIHVDDDRQLDLIVMFVDNERLFRPQLDVVSRLRTLMPVEELRERKNEIEKIQSRTDEERFLRALNSTASEYGSGKTDVVNAVDSFVGVRYRDNYALHDRRSVWQIDCNGNTVYASEEDVQGKRELKWRLWVFDKDGTYVGEVRCTEKLFNQAVGLAKTMARTDEAARKPEPVEVPRYERAE